MKFTGRVKAAPEDVRRANTTRRAAVVPAVSSGNDAPGASAPVLWVDLKVFLTILTTCRLALRTGQWRDAGAKEPG